jgi:hypothetical protein
LFGIATIRFFGANQLVRLGVACTLAQLPALVYLMFWITHMHGQVWWTYMLLLPGAVVGSFIAPYLCPRVAKATSLPVPATAALTIILCLGVNILGITLVFK